MSRSLTLAQTRLDDGERDLVAIVSEMKGLLTAHPEIAIDYVSIADPDSLAELNTVQPQMVALIAARVGKTRLIDNRVLTASGLRVQTDTQG